MSKCEKDLDDILNMFKKKKESKVVLTPFKDRTELAREAEAVNNNPMTFSAIGLMKSESIAEIIHGFQSPSYYRLEEKVDFREDRKHEFKSFVKINLKTLVPLIFEYMCAFQNCEGGTLFIGIDDDGYVKGVFMTDKDIDRLLL